MSERPSATIIAFPGRQPAAPLPEPALAEPDRLQRALASLPEPAAASPDRLQRALASLELALAEQRVAVAKWRQSLGELRGSMQGLGEAFGTYHDRLGTLAEGIEGLNREARRMEAWADGVLGGAGA